MRKEVIVILLVIIFMTTISSFLSRYMRIPELDKILYDSVIGVVGAGNFTYWQMGHTGPLLIELTSIKGDADLYISESVRPSYELDMNNFSSTTCGVDTVKIPVDFPRPIGIGVFGHWSHQFSEYNIQVFLDTTAEITEEQLLAAEQAQLLADQKQNGKKKEPPTRVEEDSKPRFLRLINILDMIFEMFVL